MAQRDRERCYIRAFRDEKEVTRASDGEIGVVVVDMCG